MKVAVMQPYFLPYLGYWQLLAESDRFVLLDEVNYIVRGWVNRNRIWVGGKENWMTVPLANASQNRLISHTVIVEGGEWKEKLMRTVQGAYGRAPFFDQGRDLLAEILRGDERGLAAFLERSIRVVADRLGITTVIESSGSMPRDRNLVGEARILEICRYLEADTYLNLPGGKELYHPPSFESRNVGLRFLHSEWEHMELSSPSGVHNLSLLDLWMHNPIDSMKASLAKCSFNP